MLKRVCSCDALAVDAAKCGSEQKRKEFRPQMSTRQRFSHSIDARNSRLKHHANYGWPQRTIQTKRFARCQPRETV